MHEPGKAGCPRLPLQTSDMAMANKRTPCMASCPTERQRSPHAHAMQQGHDLVPAPQTDPLSPNTNHNNGSLIGPSLIHAHADGPRPEPHTNAPKQPTSLGHSYQAKEHSDELLQRRLPDLLPVAIFRFLD